MKFVFSGMFLYDWQNHTTASFIIVGFLFRTYLQVILLILLTAIEMEGLPASTVRELGSNYNKGRCMALPSIHTQTFSFDLLCLPLCNPHPWI